MTNKNKTSNINARKEKKKPSQEIAYHNVIHGR